MPNWFQTQDPSFVPRPPAEITAAAGRGGYQAPTGYANPTVFGGYDPRTGQYHTQPDPRYQQPPADPNLHGPWEGPPITGGGFDRAAYDERYRRGLIPGSPGYEASRQQNPGIDPQTGRPWQATDQGPDAWGGANRRYFPNAYPQAPQSGDQPQRGDFEPWDRWQARLAAWQQQHPGVAPAPGGQALPRPGGFGAPTPGGMTPLSQIVGQVASGAQQGSQIGQIVGQVAGGAQPGGGMVQLRAPTGQTRSVPAAQAAFYLARGASKV